MEVIREAKLEELETIYELFKNNIDHFNFMKNLFVKSDNPFSRIAVYKKDNKILGAIIYSIIYERAELDQIAVTKSIIRHGIGGKLMEYFLEDVKKSKCEEISLEVFEKNKPAIKLYKKYGFKEVAIREKYYPDGNGLLMVKKVK